MHLRPFPASLRAALRRIFHVAEWQALLLWAIVAGLVGAAATELFRRALIAIGSLAFGHGDDMVAIAIGLPWWLRVAVPAAGGLAAGGLLVLARRTTRTHATSDYMEAIVVGDGRIPVGQTLMRSASSMLSIASGASIGREGSMVQLAALGASLVGKAMRFPAERLRLLVACGAAAGITSAYSAPIAAAFFVAEIVLGSIAMESVGPIIVAAVVANIFMRELAGYHPPYEMPAFQPIFGPEVVLFALLGVVLGLGAALFLLGLRGSRRLFSRLPLALPLRMALGGMAVGLVSVAVPQVWGNGYSVVNDVLHAPPGWQVLALLLAAKLIATFATAGSGAVGGVFTPALFFGCIAGSLFGAAAQSLWPGLTSAPSAYAIVGMGAFLAAATQAPLMAILMIFEMTLSYPVMLPLMATSVVAYFVARSTRSGSMYEITEQRRQQDEARLQLRGLHMRDLVRSAETVVRPDAGLAEMRRLFLEHPVKYLYVTDAEGLYLGVVALKALSATEEGPAPEGSTAADLLSQDIAPIPSDMDLAQALQRFLEHRGERLPVIERTDHPLLLGVVDKTTLLQTYVRLSD